jgi:hypothetical protein
MLCCANQYMPLSKVCSIHGSCLPDLDAQFPPILAAISSFPPQDFSKLSEGRRARLRSAS